MKFSAAILCAACGLAAAATPADRDRFESMLSQQIFSAMSGEQRGEIIREIGEPSQARLDELTGPFDRILSPWADTPFGPSSDLELVAPFISPERFFAMTEGQRNLMVMMARTAAAGEPIPVLCLAPDAPIELLEFVESLWAMQRDMAFQAGVGSRWSATATDGGGLTQGEPTTITWSLVPDGTQISSASNRPSNMFAWLNGLYPNDEADWIPLFEQVFARWAEVSGNTYIRVSDDGARQSSGSPGVLGVRGDIRIAATTIDGGGGTLAYNFFPNYGDMVLDSADSFYNNFSSNSRRLRNIISHEAGHGFGFDHVCPANGSKLMEPFINTGFDGPQLDDILAKQRLYGDRFEPNDAPAAASALPTVNPESTFSIDNISLDDTSDLDIYRVTTTTGFGRFRVTVTPDAAEYLQGVQTSQCNSGTLTDYNEQQDISLQVRNSTGSQILDSVNATGLGGAEVIELDVTPGGTLLYVDGTGSTAQEIQRYRMTLQSIPSSFEFEPELPLAVAPGEPFEVVVRTTVSSFLFGPFVSVTEPGGSFNIPMTALGGGLYSATLPARDCGDFLVFRVQGTDNNGQTIQTPADGSNVVLSIGEVSIPLEDTFATDLGWTVGGEEDNASTGQWERGTPEATGAQPAGGFDDAFCFATGLVRGVNDGANDIDGGRTTLTSPVFSLADAIDTSISYVRWFSNSTANNPFEDVMVVELSNDGGINWTQIDQAGPTTDASGGWVPVTVDAADFLTPTASMRLRFVAADDGSGAIVEAAVDAVRIGASVSCEDTFCDADINRDGVADIFDILGYFDLFASGQGDRNGDGTSDVFDIIDFFNDFGAC